MHDVFDDPGSGVRRAHNRSLFVKLAYERIEYLSLTVAHSLVLLLGDHGLILDLPKSDESGRDVGKPQRDLPHCGKLFSDL
jgi:hypothetical protein